MKETQQFFNPTQSKKTWICFFLKFYSNCLFDYALSYHRKLQVICTICIIDILICNLYFLISPHTIYARLRRIEQAQFNHSLLNFCIYILPIGAKLLYYLVGPSVTKSLIQQRTFTTLRRTISAYYNYLQCCIIYSYISSIYLFVYLSVSFSVYLHICLSFSFVNRFASMDILSLSFF